MILHTVCAHVGVCGWKGICQISIKKTIYTQFFYYFGKFFILKMIHNHFKVSIQCNHTFEIITTTNHNLLGHLCYTPFLLNSSFPHCLLEKLWGLYEPSAVTLWISLVQTFHTDATRSVIKTQIKFPDAPDIYRETIYKWRDTEQQVPC